MKIKHIIIACTIIGAINSITLSNALAYDETDPYYNAGRMTGMLLGALYERNRTPHIDVHDKFIHVANNGTSDLYLDLDSVQSLKDTENVKIAKSNIIIVDYSTGKITKYANTYIFNKDNTNVQMSTVEVTVFDLKGKLLGGPVDVSDKGKIQSLPPIGPFAALVNTVYFKLYNTPFYSDLSIPILTHKQALLDT